MPQWIVDRFVAAYGEKKAEEILAAVTELQQHPTAGQVFLEMKREHPSIALGTVYLPPCREQEKDNLMEEKYYER